MIWRPSTQAFDILKLEGTWKAEGGEIMKGKMDIDRYFERHLLPTDENYSREVTFSRSPCVDTRSALNPLKWLSKGDEDCVGIVVNDMNSSLVSKPLLMQTDPETIEVYYSASNNADGEILETKVDHRGYHPDTETLSYLKFSSEIGVFTSFNFIDGQTLKYIQSVYVFGKVTGYTYKMTRIK
jgi:hypothetical protein